MQYMLMTYVNEDGWSGMTRTEQEQGVAAYVAYMEAMTKAGVLQNSNRLAQSSAATTVRLANGKPQVLDGPYADSKEQFGGYFLIDVADLDAAIAWAARCPAAAHGVVEVRPIWTMPAELRNRNRMSAREGDAHARSTADAVARRSYGKLVAFLVARTRDVAAAEDALAEAFASALAEWPRNGCPSNPEAWLLTVARRKSIDGARRRRSARGGCRSARLLAEELGAAATDADIPDHRLALMFACAHPAIEAGIRAPLMLQVVLGPGREDDRLGVPRLARGDGQATRPRQGQDPPAPASRSACPSARSSRDRLDAVLDAIYAAFAEGWNDPGGTDGVRRDLTDEAMFLADS